MQDSLGGNAKTLMFVNFSPADYNCDETVTSLNYAARVKKIVNNASKVSHQFELICSAMSWLALLFYSMNSRDDSVVCSFLRRCSICCRC